MDLAITIYDNDLSDSIIHIHVYYRIYSTVFNVCVMLLCMKKGK